MKRRSFLAALAVLPALTILGGSALRLAPRREGLDVAMDGDFKTENLRYKVTERFSKPAELSAKALEDLLAALHDNVALSNFAVRPTKLIVHPEMLERVRYILTHRPGFFERLWWKVADLGRAWPT